MSDHHPITSPCINICVIHPREQICAGCYRSMDEIMSWATMTPAQRRAIMTDLPARASRIRKPRA